MLAPLVARYFATPTVRRAAELRLQESLLGATLVDRLRLKLDVTSAEVPRVAPRRRLMVVDDGHPQDRGAT